MNSSHTRTNDTVGVTCEEQFNEFRNEKATPPASHRQKTERFHSLRDYEFEVDKHKRRTEDNARKDEGNTLQVDLTFSHGDRGMSVKRKFLYPLSYYYIRDWLMCLNPSVSSCLLIGPGGISANVCLPDALFRVRVLCEVSATWHISVSTTIYI